MIKLTKSIKPQDSFVSLQKTQNTTVKKAEQTPVGDINLNLQPSYPIVQTKSPEVAAKLALESFNNEFGEAKSATYLCEIIKQKKRQGADEETINQLDNVRRQYSQKVKQMRKHVFSKKYDCFDAYIAELKKYIKQNGTYLNCNECADLTLDNLRKQNVRANNIFLYSSNMDGVRVNKAEHVFTLVGQKADFNPQDPSTWGEDAVICDAWLNKTMKAQEGIEFYKEFFDFNPDRHKMSFVLSERNFQV